MSTLGSSLQSAEFISARRQLAQDVIEILRKRDSVDAPYWSYAILAAHPSHPQYEISVVAEGQPQLYTDQETPWAVVARESSGAYEEIFVLADKDRVMWLPETGPASELSSLAGVIELYGLWVGTVPELEAHLDEISYP